MLMLSLLSLLQDTTWSCRTVHQDVAGSGDAHRQQPILAPLPDLLRRGGSWETSDGAAHLALLPHLALLFNGAVVIHAGMD
jgi:hypothetical protein